MNPYVEGLIVLLLLVVLFLIIEVVFRYISCWNRLEKFYLLSSSAQIRDFGCQWINIASPFDPSGTINQMRWVIKAGANAEGVCFSFIFPFGFTQRPILIPWDDVILADQAYIGLSRHELIPKRVPEVQFIISETLNEKLMKFRTQL